MCPPVPIIPWKNIEMEDFDRNKESEYELMGGD